MILNTTDGGDSWNSQSIFSLWNLHSVYFIDSQTGCVVGNFEKIRHTTNGGNSWSDVYDGSLGNFYSIQFFDNQTGWVVGEDGQILKTTNGGLNWEHLTSGITSTLYSIDFLDLQSGWAVGSYGSILETNDGGLSWNYGKRETGNTLYSVCFVDNETGWIVGSDGTIMKKMDESPPSSIYTPDISNSRIPKGFILNQNYPNPFNSITMIQYELHQPSTVTLKIYNSLGQIVCTLVDEKQSSGIKRIAWDGKDEHGISQSSGFYICYLKIGQQSATRKMLLLK